MRSRVAFLTGLVLIISNFIVGKLAVPLFVIHPRVALIVYLFSWLMLLAGVILCGRDGLLYATMCYRRFERTLAKHTTHRAGRTDESTKTSPSKPTGE